MKNLIFLLSIFLVINTHGQTIGNYSKNAYVGITFVTQEEINHDISGIELNLNNIELKKISINDTGIVGTLVDSDIERKSVEIIKIKSTLCPVCLFYYFTYPKNIKEISILINGDNKEKGNFILKEEDFKIHQGVVITIMRDSKSAKEARMTSIELDGIYKLFIDTEDY